MRLLNATTLQLKQFYSDIPPYAILSHTWGDEEVSLQELDAEVRLQSLDATGLEPKRGFAKIAACCRQALADSLEWAWVDTCCIDKTSSAELSEAINSMYAWYRDAQSCYALLEDVPTAGFDFPEEAFRSARWFTRGWCLQELIAPSNVEFYAADWSELGTKRSLYERIEAITRIPKPALLYRALDECSIAQKMSWASSRQTSRVEDAAYCLLGIFGVNMPMLYGEGERAFQRLQEEIILQTEDYSFLLWTEIPPQRRRATGPLRLPIFAPSPACFHRDGPADRLKGRLDYTALKLAPRVAFSAPSAGYSMAWGSNPCQITSRGLLVSLPIQTVASRTAKEGFNPRPDSAVLWTGYVYQEFLVCVFVTPERHVSTHRYIRSGVAHAEIEVELVEAGRFSEFDHTPVYLSRKQQVWEFEPSTWPAPSGPRQALKSEVQLSLSASNTSDIVVSLPKVHIQGNQIYDMNRPDHATNAKFWRVARGSSQVLTFFIFQNPGRSPFNVCVEHTEGHERVFVSAQLVPRPGRPICTINKEPARTLFPSRKGWGTDRATRELRGGETVAAGVKAVKRASGCTRFIMQIALLPGTSAAGGSPRTEAKALEG